MNIPCINIYDSEDLYHDRIEDQEDNVNDNTPLILAAQWELYDVVETLLSKYTGNTDDTSGKGGTGHTALTVFKLLIENGADVNKSKDLKKAQEIKTQEGLTPLILAARGGNLETFTLLLKKGYLFFV